MGKNTTYKYLLIGGAPKSATTSVFRYLADHPQVCPANRKETYFFAREFDQKRVCNSDEKLESFEKYFAHCDQLHQLRVEATPYTLYSNGAAKKISTLLPNATMLFILRNPVERFLSDYRFHIQRGHPSVQGTFEEFVEWQDHLQGIPNLFKQGCYIEYLRSFFNTFHHNKILIIFFEDLKVNTLTAMEKLCAETGIEPGFYTNYNFDAHNQTINVRYSWLNQASIHLEPVVANMREHTICNPTINSLFEKILRTIKKIFRAVNNQPSNHLISNEDEIRAKLAEFYAPFNQRLSEEMDRSLPW